MARLRTIREWCPRPIRDVIGWHQLTSLRQFEPNAPMPLMCLCSSAVIILEQTDKARIAIWPAVHSRPIPTLEYGFDILARERPMGF
jgi:hypothetical protein